MKISSSRAIIASTQRINARTVRNLISHCQPGEGIFHQTTASEDYCEPVIEVYNEEHNLTCYLVESEKFAGRYYLLRQYEQSGAWRFSGDDKLKEKYVAKVEAFRTAQQPVEQPVEEVAAPVAEQTFIPPIFNGPWHGAIVHISDKEMAELKARVKARALAKVCADVRALEVA